MARSLQLLLAGGLLAGFCWIVSIALRERYDAGLNMPDYSTYSKDERGLRPLTEQLKQLPLEPGGRAKFKSAPITLPIYLTAHKGLFLIVEPGRPIDPEARPRDGPEELNARDSGITVEQAERILAWVAKDPRNTLVLCTTGSTPIHEALNVAVTPGPYVEENFPAARIPLRTAYTEGIDKLELGNVTGFRVGETEPMPHEVLWELPQERGKIAGAVLIPHGQGLVIIIGDPTLLTTDGRKRGDNALVLTNIAAKHAIDGEVMFDEYWHGFQSSATFLGYLRKEGQVGWMIQMGVVLVALAWAVAIRQGPAVPMPTGARTDAVDYAAAMARIYQGAGVTRWLADGLVRDFLNAVTVHVRLKRSATRKEIQVAWNKKHPDSLQRLTRLLDIADHMEGDDIGRRQLLSAAQEFDDFRQEIISPKMTRPKAAAKGKIPLAALAS